MNDEAFAEYVAKRLFDLIAASFPPSGGKLDQIIRLLREIKMSQSDIDATTAGIEGEVADLGKQDQAILAAQTAFTAEIQNLQGQGVNTSALVSAAADLLTAQGADDATVAALTTAAGAPAQAVDTNPPARR